MRVLLALGALSAATAMCFGSAPAKAEARSEAARSGVQLDAMDHSVRPQDDLFGFANGAWLRDAAIPPDRSRYGVDTIMAERGLRQQRELLESASRDPSPDVRKAAALYASFMDEAAVERAGLGALSGELALIEAMRSRRELSERMARLDRLGVAMPISTFIDPDARRSDRYAFWLYGGGLGLPERDYYLSADPKMVQVRGRYRVHLAKLLALSGVRNAQALADDVLRLETEIARTHWSRLEARDPEKTYNPVAPDQLAKLAPQIDWSAWLRAQDVPASGVRIIVRQPSTATEVAKLVGSTPLPVWKAYLRVRLLSAYGPYLPRAIAAETFAFEQGVLQGTAVQPERWKRAVSLVDQLMGEASGRLYVARHYPPHAKARVERMVQDLVAAYAERIQASDWMSSATKPEALAKLRAMRVKVGHPERWRDYGALEIAPDDLVGNVLRARAFEAARKRAQLTGPVDPQEWRMTAATVDAYYIPTTNEIAFPAGILQPPLFDPSADEAYNYGSTGATIGHEISHGFDSRGSRYDSRGNLRDWWTAEDHRRYQAIAARLVETFGAFEPLPGRRIDGKLTLAENMADLAGLEIAYEAYRKSLGGREAPVIAGLTGAQRFLLGYAQSYMGKRREESLVAQLKTNSHAPERYRVNGVVNNLDAFYAAFDVGPGDGMYLPPNRRIRIWSAPDSAKAEKGGPS